MRNFLTIVLLSAFTWCAVAAPKIEAGSYILMDAETGTVLAEKEADLSLPPASLTKIMSMYTIFQALADGRMSMSQEVLISENAWSANVVGSKMFIEVNSRVSVQDLLYGVIVQSGNDASIALAEALSGDESAFAEEMMRSAKQIGLTDSHFENSTGLPGEKHYASARDIARVVRRTVLDFPQWYKIYAEPEYTYNDIRQPNRNRLLNSFPGADGVKTGYTKEAAYCLAASAVRDGRRLISVVMKTKSPRARERESAKLLTYGFNTFKNVRLFTLDDKRQLPVWKGEQATVMVRPTESGIFTVTRDRTLSVRFEARANLTAPLAVGDIIGEIAVLEEGEVIGRTPVEVAEAVAEAGFWKRLEDDIKINLGYTNEQNRSFEW